MKTENYSVGFVCFKNFTALDLIGPHEVLQRHFKDISIVADKIGKVVASSGLSIYSDFTFKNAPQFDILVISGGPGQSDAATNIHLLDFIKRQAVKSKYIMGVCTGSLLLAEAGVLKNKFATTHWLAVEELQRLGAKFKNQRTVWDGKILTGAGVTSGIDVALELVIKLGGLKKAKEIQLAMEYDPQPPCNTGHPSKAPKYLIEYLKSKSRFHKK